MEIKIRALQADKDQAEAQAKQLRLDATRKRQLVTAPLTPPPWRPCFAAGEGRRRQKLTELIFLILLLLQAAERDDNEY